MRWSPSDPSGDPGQHLCVHLGANCQPAAHAEVEARPPSRGIQGDRQSWRVSKARNAEGWPRKVPLDPRQLSKPRTSPHQETHPLPTHPGWVPTPTPCSDRYDSSAPPWRGVLLQGKAGSPLRVLGCSWQPRGPIQPRPRPRPIPQRSACLRAPEDLT